MNAMHVLFMSLPSFVNHTQSDNEKTFEVILNDDDLTVDALRKMFAYSLHTIKSDRVKHCEPSNLCFSSTQQSVYAPDGVRRKKINLPH